MIIFKKDGSVVRKHDISYCDDCLNGSFKKCAYNIHGDFVDAAGAGADVDYDTENGGHDGDNDNNRDDDTMLHIIFPGSIIALYTPSDVKESFYLCYVNEVKTGTTHIFDAYQHFVLPGTKYILCNPTIACEKFKSFIKYKKLSLNVFVLSPFVQMGDDLELSLAEKQWLDDSI